MRGTVEVESRIFGTKRLDDQIVDDEQGKSVSKIQRKPRALSFLVEGVATSISGAGGWKSAPAEMAAVLIFHRGNLFELQC